MTTSNKNILTLDRLKKDGSNYVSWRFMVIDKLELEANDLELYIAAPVQGVYEHELKLAADEAEDLKLVKAEDVKAKCKKKNIKALRIVASSLDPSLLTHFKSHGTAYEFWKAVEERYMLLKKPLVLSKKRQLIFVKLEEDGDMDKYLDNIAPR